jgi:hypothetical protein
MNISRMSAVLLSAVSVLSAVLILPRPGRAEAAPPKTEIQGAAILEHPCGKVAVQHMGLVHAGKLEEATRLGTPEMQEQWKALPAEDRKTMSMMMKEMSKSEAQFSAEIKAGGLLAIDGGKARLTVKQEHKDANGSSTDTLTQNYVLDGATCRISR